MLLEAEDSVLMNLDGAWNLSSPSMNMASQFINDEREREREGEREDHEN
jgi:hypothetical protein